MIVLRLQVSFTKDWEEIVNLASKLKNISRRDLFALSGQFGLTSTLIAAGGFGGAMSLASGRVDL